MHTNAVMFRLASNFSLIVTTDSCHPVSLEATSSKSQCVRIQSLQGSTFSSFWWK